MVYAHMDGTVLNKYIIKDTNHESNVTSTANCIFEPTCPLCTMGSYASLSVCLSVVWTGPKIRLENNSYLGKY